MNEDVTVSWVSIYTYRSSSLFTHQLIPKTTVILAIFGFRKSLTFSCLCREVYKFIGIPVELYYSYNIQNA